MTVPSTRRRRRRARKNLVVLAGATALASALVPVSASATTTGTSGYTQVNLVSDVRGLARMTDPSVVNPWGIALGPTTPLWVANDGTATATLYSGANGHDPLAKVGLTVNLPSLPTGQVFNPGTKFVIHRGGMSAPARFMFGTMGGDVVGWSPELPGITRAKVVTDLHGHLYLGLALGNAPTGPRLYASDGNGTVDVFDGNFRRLSTPPSAFSDPTLPRGLAPYGVAVLNNRVYVSYALPDGVSGPVDGAINTFDLNGRNRHRLVTGGPLDGPWGMVMAPAHWGRFGGKLLVGNEDAGTIDAFDAHTGRFAGVLRDSHGKPIVNDGLWGLAFGNGVFGTPRDLVFAAGIDDYEHGLVGIIHPTS